ncbi:MAG TPA: ABC transporter ATP-binding protein [Bryobacteraceae bacterium]|nr:ABC transporter ATP-binding protein [Bryobacteraceae bacterium]
MPSPVVEFRDVSKSYPIYPSPSARLKELACFNRISFHRDFWAVRNISFQIYPGETFCIIGENGSGKSTLLQMVAGILHPTTGDVKVQGRVAALLELGSGFNPEFSGRDNVYVNAAILGLSRREIDAKFGEIEAFAEIGDFIDQPVKTYSSGMAVRLAFSVAIHVDPEILLVDEALAVGDIYFHQRCMRKVNELREKGVTILFVTHAVAEVKSIGDRALWMDRGHMRELGGTEHVVTKYLAEMFEKDSAYLTSAHRQAQRVGHAPVKAPEIVDTIPNIDHRFGDSRAEILGIAILDLAGHSIHLLEPTSAIVVRISVRANEDITLPIVGFIMRNQMGLDFAGTNTAREGFELPPMAAGDIHTVDFHLQIPELYPSSFSFSPAVADGTLRSYTTCDWIDNAIVLQMSPADGEIYGHLHLPCRVELNRCLAKSSPVPVLTHAEPNVG